jgi:hypothetical protein
MLSDEIQARVKRQVKAITEGYKQDASNFKVKALSLPVFDSQEDHDKYHPEDAGVVDFKEHNEYVTEVLNGLRVPAELITVNADDYHNWLNGRSNSSMMRTAYCAYLLSEKYEGKP